jgi:prophage tail gpP-like protein
MIPGYPDAGSQSDELCLVLPDAGITIDHWEEYSFDSDFLTPTDSWHFVTSGRNLSKQIVDNLFVGARVLLQINGMTQGGGFIDVVDTHSDRGSGLVYSIQGRDAFSPVVDSGADPRLYTFTSDQTLEDAVHTVFENFGFTLFDISNDANRTVMTGVRTNTKKGKSLKAVKIAQQLQPYPGEGCFSYLTRFLHRFGLWCWPSADQRTVIVSVPAYDSPPTGHLVRKSDGSRSNVISGGIREDGTDQPSCILATGATYGSNQPRVEIKVVVVNELTGVIVDRTVVESDFGSVFNAKTGQVTNITQTSTQLSPIGSVIGLISRYPEAFYPPLREEFAAYLGTLAREDPVSRPMFLHDDESKTQDQLLRFAYRELSLRQQRMWTGHYVVEGHTQGPAKTPWAVDTIVTVDDDAGRGFHGPMYVRGRTFEKSRGAGTRTTLRLVLPHTISFGGPPVSGDGTTIAPVVIVGQAP